MSWRDTAERVLGERDNRDVRVKSPPIEPNVPIGTAEGGAIGEPVAKARLAEWHRNLSAIDQFASPPGWSLDAWLKLTDDAFWLYENHASYAVRNGWTARCLFAVRPGMPHLGGLADQLDGARNLKLDGGRAYWTHHGSPCRINVGCGDGSGAMLLWEIR